MTNADNKRPVVLIVGYDKGVGKKIKDRIDSIGCLGIPTLSHEVPLKMFETFPQTKIVVINFWLQIGDAVNMMRTIREHKPEIKILATVEADQPLLEGCQVAVSYLVDPLRDDGALGNRIKDLLKQ